jgi:phage shock protein PspC (stress-responsive transcriptional regulator)
MTRTTTANIGGMTFSIEEEAYVRLQQYLETIRQSLAATTYGDEVLVDIEARAAEQFSKKGAQQVVTAADVDALIAEIGSADDVAGEDAKATPPRADDRTGRRRLYRNPDDMMIAGVASGIAAYFGVSPTAVRVGFVIAALIGASGIAIYVLLWLIVPLADTASEKLEMRGAPITLEAMERLVKERVHEAKAGEAFRRGGGVASGFVRDVCQGIIRVVRALFRAAFAVAGVLLAAGAIFWAVALTLCLVFLSFGGTNGFVEFPLQEAFRGVSYAAVLAAGYLTFLLPLVGAVMLGVATAKRSWRPLVTPAIALGVLWLCAVIALSAVVARHQPEIHAIDQETRKEVRREVAVTGDFAKVRAGNDVQVRVTGGDSASVTVTGDARSIESLRATNEAGTLVLERAHDEWPLCIFCGQRGVVVDVTVPELRAAEARNAARVTVSGDTADEVVLAAQDAGRVNYSGEATRLTATTSGVARIELRGSAAFLSVTAAETSRIDADAFEGNEVQATTHDLARIVVRARALLDATASDLSAIRYHGEPEVKAAEFGNGRVERMTY